jgi:hypothetical protein
MNPSARARHPECVRRSRAGLAIAAATVVGAAGCAEDPTRKSGWEGFAPGSFVHLRITTTWSDPAKAPDVVETKHTLVEVTDQGWVTRVETRKADRWIPAEPRRVLRSPPPVHDPGAKLEDLGKEKVTIEGIEYECAKTKSVLAERTSISWTHEKLGVLKWETASDGDDRMWMLVTRLAAKAMVAGKEI